MPLLALIFIFVAVPLVELYVIVELVGPAIGVPLTIALLAVDSLAGAWLMKSQGRAVWQRFNETLRGGGVPHREIVDGVLVIFGGAFLITPGFVTDILGFFLLIPPTRALLRKSLQRRLERRAVFGVARAAGAARGAGGGFRAGRGEAPPAWDVDGTAVDREDAEFELPPRTARRPPG